MEGLRDHHIKRTKTDKYHMISSYVESNIKNDTTEIIYKTEIALQILKTNFCLPERKHVGRGIN